MLSARCKALKSLLILMPCMTVLTITGVASNGVMLKVRRNRLPMLPFTFRLSKPARP
jgi:hypothetical protein